MYGPHVHRDAPDAFELLGGEALVVAGQRSLATTVGHVVNHPLGGIRDQGHVLMALLERGLIHTQVLRHVQLSPSQTAAHRPLHHPVHLVPAQSQKTSHRRGVGRPQPVDHQGFEQRRKRGARLRPWHPDRLDAVLRALHPRHLGSQDRPVLAGVQVTPPPSARVVAARRRAALRTRELPLTPVLHRHLHLSLLQPQLHPAHPPRLLDAQDPPVQVCVSHGPTLPRTHHDSGRAQRRSLHAPTSPGHACRLAREAGRRPEIRGKEGLDPSCAYDRDPPHVGVEDQIPKIL